MNNTDWIVYLVVAFAAFYIIKSIFFRKGKKGCCSKGCSNPDSEKETKTGSLPEKEDSPCHKKSSK